MSTDATEIATQAPEPRPGTTDDKLLPHFNEIGAVPDRIIAAKAGVAINTVRNFRAHYGIPSSRPVTPTKAKKAKKSPKATAKASAPPKEKGRPGRKSKIKPFHDLVGKVSDEELAKMAGAAASTVENYRRKNKIPAFEGTGGETANAESPKPSKSRAKKASGKTPRPGDAPKGRPGRKSKVAPFHGLMGTVPDEEVAAKAGVKVTAVQAYRRKHGIPAFAGQATAAKAPAASTMKSAAKASAQAPKATSTTRWGWRVTFATGQARLVIASSAGEAVEVAAQSGLGELVQVERLIEALGGNGEPPEARLAAGDGSVGTSVEREHPGTGIATGWMGGVRPTKWGNEPDRFEWWHKDFPCLLLRNGTGVWCGYVEVSNGGLDVPGVIKRLQPGVVTSNGALPGSTGHWFGTTMAPGGVHRDMAFCQREVEYLVDRLVEFHNLVDWEL